MPAEIGEAQQASGVQAEEPAVSYSDAEYSGGYGHVYFIGVDGGATFFNNYLATTFDFVSRMAGAMLVGGKADEVRKVSTFVPVYLVSAAEDVVEKYKTANRVNAVKGLGDIVIHYNPAQPLQQVVLAKANPVHLAALIDAGVPRVHRWRQGGKGALQMNRDLFARGPVAFAQGAGRVRTSKELWTALS